MTTAFKPLTVTELLELEIPEADWLVDGLIQEGTLALLSAREKSGKGLLTIDLVVSVAEGSQFLGRDTSQGTAIYCATEETLGEVQSRLMNRVGLTKESPPVMILPLDGTTGDTLDITKAESVARLKAMLDEQRPKVAVIDVLREIHDRKEDSSDEMAPIVRVLRDLTRQTGSAIVLNHHMSKGGQARGSTAIAAAADVTMDLESTANQFASASLGGILRVKGRSVPGQQLNITFGDHGRWTATGDPPPRSGTAPAKARILAALLKTPEPLSVKQISEQSGVAEGTVNNTLGKLKRDDPPLVNATPSGRQGGRYLYSLTTAGEVAAEGG